MRKLTIRKELIHDRHTRTRCRVRVVEESPVTERYSHRAKVVASHEALSGVRQPFRWCQGTSDDRVGARALATAERQIRNETNRCCPWDRAGLFEEAFPERPLGVTRWVSIGGERDLRGQDALRAESGIDTEHARKALDEQTGAHEQDHGERHLRDHKRRAEPAHAFP